MIGSFLFPLLLLGGLGRGGLGRGGFGQGCCNPNPCCQPRRQPCCNPCCDPCCCKRRRKHHKHHKHHKCEEYCCQCFPVQQCCPTNRCSCFDEFCC